MNPTVYVNGTALDLENVEYSITVTHGRNDITAAPAPSDASMTLYGFTSIPVTISDVVEVEAYGVTRFTGRVTDTQLSHDFNPNGPTIGAPVTSYVARLDVTMIGNLSLLGLAFVGAAGYARELLNDRVENILTDANLAEVVQQRRVLKATQSSLVELEAPREARVLCRGLGQSRREAAHAQAVTAGARVTRVDREDGGADEAIEELPNLAGQAGVRQRDRGRPRQRDRELFVPA